MTGMRVSRIFSNCSFVLGSKRGRIVRSTVAVGSFESTTTAFAAVVTLRSLLMPILPNKSSACFRSDSCSVRRRRSLRVASSSSLLSSLSSASLLAFSACLSAIRWALDFLFAAASASALACRSAATLAFSRSTSESSAASHDSRTSLSSSSSSNLRLPRAPATGGEDGGVLLSSSSSARLSSSQPNVKQKFRAVHILLQCRSNCRAAHVAIWEISYIERRYNWWSCKVTMTCEMKMKMWPTHPTSQAFRHL